MVLENAAMCLDRERSPGDVISVRCDGVGVLKKEG